MAQYEGQTADKEDEANGWDGSIVIDGCMSGMIRTPSMLLLFAPTKKLNPHCSVLVGFRNGLESELRMQKCLFHHQTERSSAN